MRSRDNFLGFFALLPFAGLSGCIAAKPAPGTYTVDFPSETTAIATDTVQVFVYPFDAMPETCSTLVEDEKSGTPVPTPIAQTDATSPCDLQAGGNDLPVGFGSYVFLAVATRTQYGPFLIGCASQTLSAANTTVSIPLELTDFTNPLPMSTCTMLSQRCSGGSC